jgi:DNA-binding transcriptional LysR family regulator
VQTIYNEPFSAVARPGNSAAKGRAMSWADLSCQSWVLPSAGSLSRMAVDLAFVRQGRIGPRAVVECQSLEQIRQQVRFSDLFGVLPTADALQLERQGLLRIVRRDMAAHVSPISLLWRKDREMAVEERRFIEILSGVASEYVEGREVRPDPRIQAERPARRRS